MPGPTTISEALETLPSSSAFPTSPASNKSTRRLLVVTKKKFSSSTSAESHKPPGLKWVPSHPQHLLSNNSWNSALRRDAKVKESILITGRDAGVKQSLKFKCRLPLPFLEQNGLHDEDILKDDDDNASEEADDEDGGEEATEGLGFTASDLEMDAEETGGAGMTIELLEDLESEASSSPKPKTTTSTAPPTKRRRISKDDEAQERYDSLPRDFLELLKTEVPGGKNDVSPGDFARVWKMSGRNMGNELVLAQNEYFDKPKAKDIRRKGKRGGK